MTRFHDFLLGRISSSGFTTEDTLATCLPLMRQVQLAHESNRVAPLQGIDALRVEKNQIWYHQTAETSRSENLERLRQMIESSTSEAIQEAPPDVAMERSIDSPAFVAGYVCWEHLIGHHDALTDIFCLGQILASVACGLDFENVNDVKRFVAHRENLYAIQPGMHPVVAKAILRMTELDRDQRAQDLPSVIESLNNYRYHQVDCDIDPANIDGFESRDLKGKQQLLLDRLQRRLFDVSRRNRLLHFRPTRQTINLTQASIPLSFDHSRIREDQVWVWDQDTRQSVCDGTEISLNRRLNFSEAIYLPGTLDRILTESRRDMAEYGFVELKLVACMLRWANLKESPKESYESPLVLIPVKLKKKRGVQDSYGLEPLSELAEINPVVRYLFKRWYAIELPETVDLTSTDLHALHDYMTQSIASSDPGVVLRKIEKPRIELLHHLARRQLEQYRRRARISGRGVRSFLGLDYSYDPANYHPMGIKLFNEKIRRRPLAFAELNRRSSFDADSADDSSPEKRKTDGHTAAASASQGQGQETWNPYLWDFDLCHLTLANFRYRRMSLVRDYEQLLDHQRESQAFSNIFSLDPRPLDDEGVDEVALGHRFDVLPADPTQTQSIVRSRRGDSYIIQGPPGTGKSQTIANLIADFASHGKRVLFVCEKRAAIDVVYARLKQTGLAELCSLIHDSQGDKKSFVMDLKSTYESFLASGTDRGNSSQTRDQVVARLSAECTATDRFVKWMTSSAEESGISRSELIRQVIRLRPHLPDLADADREALPNYAIWHRHRDIIERVYEHFARLTGHSENRQRSPNQAVIARHPLAILSVEIGNKDSPLQSIQRYSSQLKDGLAGITSLTKDFSVIRPDLDWNQWVELIEYAEQLRPIAERGALSLLDRNHAQAAEFDRQIRELDRMREDHNQLVAANVNWRERPMQAELEAAIEREEILRTKWWPILFPSWWRLRRAMNRWYDFTAHAIQPARLSVLTKLRDEYQTASRIKQQVAEISAAFKLPPEQESIEAVHALRNRADKLPSELLEIHEFALRSDQGPKLIRSISDAATGILAAREAVSKLLDRRYRTTPAEIPNRLQAIDQQRGQLPDFLAFLKELSVLPNVIQSALTSLDLHRLQLEAAIGDTTLNSMLRSDYPIVEFSQASWEQRIVRTNDLFKAWLNENSQGVLSKVQIRLLENVATSSSPSERLSTAEKTFKASYNRGRKILEHEFGKSMRYKSIRDLVSGDSGLVVRDLKPVWLMSPLSVSDTLPLDNSMFDVVIFDEASQITLEAAVPSLFRAPQTIVVGDEMQLPPTSFFATNVIDEELEELLFDADAVEVPYELHSNSFLNHAAKNLSATMLGWHYRSRNEALISFSNQAFYHGQLRTIPEESLLDSDWQPIDVGEEPYLTEPLSDDPAEDQDPPFKERFEVAAAEVLQRPISFHHLRGGIYEKRRNRGEAEYIALLVRDILQRKTGKTIAVIAFSEAQQGEIEDALERLANRDEAFREWLDAESQREEDGQFVGLLVKNLENIQGDERDIVILSICYAPDANGRMIMNFGPINQSGGEKRLNVAFSRAKHHMVVVTTITYGAITNDYNLGANCLKNYLRYSEAISAGQKDLATQILCEVGGFRDTATADLRNQLSDAVADEIDEALRSRGFLVDRNIGHSSFRCDLAIRRPEDSIYRLGILLETPDYFANPNTLDRELFSGHYCLEILDGISSASDSCRGISTAIKLFKKSSGG